MASMMDAIEMIEEALRVAAPQASDIEISRHAEIIRMRGMLASISNRVRSGRGPTDGKKDLEAVSNALRVTFDALEKCRPDALQALYAQGDAPITMAQTISDLNERVRAAHGTLSADVRPMLRGRLSSRLGPSVAASCAKAYEALTGKGATISTSATKIGHPASGPFLVLVTVVFRALQINASAENCARSAVRARRAKDKELPSKPA